jgi:hypothetical protein
VVVGGRAAQIPGLTRSTFVSGFGLWRVVHGKFP